MAPPPRAFIDGTTSRQKRIAAITFRSKSYCHASSVTSRKLAADDVPALFTRMSTPPKRLPTAATNFSTSAILVTSVGSARISAPVSFWMVFAASTERG